MNEISLGSATLVTMEVNKLAYCTRDLVEAAVIVDLLNALDFPHRSIHPMMWFLMSAKTFSAVIHVFSLVSIHKSVFNLNNRD